MEFRVLAATLAAATGIAATPWSQNPTIVVDRTVGYAPWLVEMQTPAPKETLAPAEICSAPIKVTTENPRGPFDKMTLVGTATSAPAGVCTALAVFAEPEKGVRFLFVVRVPPGQGYRTNALLPGVDVARQPGNDFVTLSLCSVKPACAASKTGVTYMVTPAKQVYTERAGRYAPFLNPKVEDVKLTATTSGAGEWWANSVTVPWPAFAFPKHDEQSIAYDVRFSAVLETQPKAELAGTLTFTLRPALATIGATPSPDDPRWATLTQYQQYVSPPLTPPPSAHVVIADPSGSGPATLKLASTPSPSRSKVNLPPPSIDIYSPVSERLLFAGVIAQPDALQNIASDLTEAVPVPIPTPFCKTCKRFQDLVDPWFKLAAAGKTLGVGKNFGADDLPFKAAGLPNLNAGGVVRYDDGSTAVSLMHAAPDKPPAKGGATYGDTGVSVTYSQDTLAATVLASYVKRTPAPAPLARSGPGVVTYSRSEMYGLMLQSSLNWVDPNVRGETMLAPVFRVLYDRTHAATDGLVGAKLLRNVVLGPASAGIADTIPRRLLSTAFTGGYRSVDRGFSILDGTAVTLPAVGGPFGALDVAWKKPNIDTPDLDISASGLAYYSAADRARFGSVKISGQHQYVHRGHPDLVTTFGLYLSYSGSRSNGTLAALSATGLGDDPYQTALNLQSALERRTSFFSHDAEVGITAGFPGTDLKSKVAVGWVFDHLAPVCNLIKQAPPFAAGATPAPVNTLHCEQGSHTSIVTGTVGVNLTNLDIAFQYKPSFDLSSRSSTSSERAYAGILNARFGKCVNLTVTTTNDAGDLSSLSVSRLKTATQVELDAVTHFRAAKVHLAPTLVVGFANEFGYDTAPYVGGLTPTGTQFQFDLPFPTHKRTFYAAGRVGTRSFVPAMKVDKSCLGPLDN
jgi:hypothetical protein